MLQGNIPAGNVQAPCRQVQEIKGERVSVNGAAPSAIRFRRRCPALGTLKAADGFKGLDRNILSLELRIEQLVIHLRSMKGHYAEAECARRELLNMLHLLRTYKEQREFLEDQLTISTAA